MDNDWECKWISYQDSYDARCVNRRTKNYTTQVSGIVWNFVRQIAVRTTYEYVYDADVMLKRYENRITANENKDIILPY